MKYIVFALVFSLVPPAISIAGDNPSSEMQPPATTEPSAPAQFDDRFYAPKPANTTGDSESEHCKQLRRQITELKGKPQRRHAVIERHKRECTSAGSTYDPGQAGSWPQ